MLLLEPFRLQQWQVLHHPGQCVHLEEDSTNATSAAKVAAADKVSSMAPSRGREKAIVAPAMRRPPRTPASATQKV